MGNSKWLKLEKQPRSKFSKDLFHLSQREKQREWKRETRFYSYGFTCQITTSAQGLVSPKPRSGTNIWISLMDSSGPGTWLIFPRHGITELCWKQSSWPLNQAQTRHAGVVRYALYLLNHYAIPSLSLSSQCFAKMCTMKKKNPTSILFPLELICVNMQPNLHNDTSLVWVTLGSMSSWDWLSPWRTLPGS